MIPRPEHPRPLLQRKDWLNLNGEWLFREDPDDTGLQDRWHLGGLGPDCRHIVVPFPVESEASGIHDTSPANIVWYERDFDVPAGWSSRIVVRFGAVDHWARVFVNGQEVGQHRGGYSPFSFDINHALKPGSNRLTVRVEDSLSWTQPRGKQAGTTRWPIDYDPVTGIWQTVWLELLPTVSIEGIASQYSLTEQVLTLSVEFSRQVAGELVAELLRDGKVLHSASVRSDRRAEARCHLKVTDPVLWSPDDPQLYDIRLLLHDEEHGEKDIVSAYAGLREVAVKDGNYLLNGEQLYLRGVLDQGYFPGGWYSPLDDAAIRRDIELALAMGFNCVRKHQKAEDPRFLYWADRMGLLVWAEMPSGRIFSTELVETLTEEWTALLKRDRGHPCVITWVPFNESWGVWHQSTRPEQRQFVEAIVHLTKTLDQSRPVVGNDGWEFSAGDLWTLHLYYDGADISRRLQELMREPGSVVAGGDVGQQRVGALPGASIEGLPLLLTECGGVGFGHYGESDFSYGELPTTEAELERDIAGVAGMVNAGKSLQGFVWTQLTDVQQEVNGLLYFDREPKLPLATLHKIFSAVGQS